MSGQLRCAGLVSFGTLAEQALDTNNNAGGIGWRHDHAPVCAERHREQCESPALQTPLNSLGAKAEPGDDGRVPGQVRLLKRTVELLASSVMPLESVAVYVGLGAADVEMLAGLPKHHLSGQSAVVHLAKLKSVVSKAPTGRQELPCCR